MQRVPDSSRRCICAGLLRQGRKSTAQNPAFGLRTPNPKPRTLKLHHLKWLPAKAPGIRASHAKAMFYCIGLYPKKPGVSSVASGLRGAGQREDGEGDAQSMAEKMLCGVGFTYL